MSSTIRLTRISWGLLDDSFANTTRAAFDGSTVASIASAERFDSAVPAAETPRRRLQAASVTIGGRR